MGYGFDRVYCKSAWGESGWQEVADSRRRAKSIELAKGVIKWAKSLVSWVVKGF